MGGEEDENGPARTIFLGQSPYIGANLPASTNHSTAPDSHSHRHTWNPFTTHTYNQGRKTEHIRGTITEYNIRINTNLPKYDYSRNRHANIQQSASQAGINPRTF